MHLTLWLLVVLNGPMQTTLSHHQTLGLCLEAKMEIKKEAPKDNVGMLKCVRPQSDYDTFVHKPRRAASAP